MRPARLFLSVALLLAPATTLAQPVPLLTAAARQRGVERGLLPRVAVPGETPATIEDRMRHYHVPGVSIAVINDGRVEWARGYGVTEFGGRTRVDTTTLFQAGSISKPVAAMGALALVEQGRLALDEDVNARLTSWKVPASDLTGERRVTLRGLLSHSAGLTVHGFPGYVAGTSLPTLVQVLNGVAPANTAPVRVDVAPGTIWRYSGGGITVMQLLMEDVTGEPFPAFMQRTVLGPLGMAHSTFAQPLPPSYATRAASGHERLDTPVPGRFHAYPEMAAAGLWTTPSDLARWAIEVQRAYRGESSGVLSPRMTREMLTTQFGAWGLGVQLAGAGDSAMFLHGGRDEGFVADLRAFVHRGQGVVIMTNGVNGRLLAELARSVALAYGWPIPARPARTIARLDGASLGALAGTYVLALGRDTTRLRVTREGGRLFLQQSGGTGIRGELLPEGGLSFFDADDGTGFRFVLDSAAASPTAASVTIVQGTRTFTAPRAPR